jgi:two-component system, LytTR family, response regulator LytT
MQALIVEDEKHSSDRLKQLLLDVDHEVTVVGSPSSVEETRLWFRDHSVPDLIFMDIQLGDGTAFDVLPDISDKIPIIFTTAYDQFALKAFEYNSLDYLLKPIEKDKLRSAIEKYETRSGEPVDVHIKRYDNLERILNGDFKKRFLVKLGDQYIPIEASEIHYFYYEDGACRLQTTDKSYIIDHSLDQVDDMVNPMDFFRVNRQYIVTLRSIREIHSYFNSRLLIKLQPSSIQDVIVSRDRVGQFKRWMDL